MDDFLGRLFSLEVFKTNIGIIFLRSEIQK